jgi:hypothetical protein
MTNKVNDITQDAPWYEVAVKMEGALASAMFQVRMHKK